MPDRSQHKDRYMGTAKWKLSVQQFINMSDVVLYALQWSDFPALIAVSHTTRALRCGTKSIVNQRIFKLLSLFMDGAAVSEFLANLESCNGAIYGSVVFAIMAPMGECSPRDLNVVVPAGLPDTPSSISQFFKRHGYISTSERVAIAFAAGVKSVTVFRKQNVKPVCISESIDDSIFPPVFTSDVTSKMNILTTTNLFCPYTALATKKIALAMWHIPSPDTLRNHELWGYSILRKTNSKAFKRGCGWSCPVLWRRTGAAGGVAVFQWQPAEFDDEKGFGMGPVKELSYKWRLGEYCLNRNCRNYSIL